MERDNEALDTMKPGRRFLVLDAGGGTIDIAMQEVREDRKLQDINRAQGGDWGAIFVDEEYKQMLEESNFLQERIKNSFPKYTVVIPQGCGLAVLKGAVLYGHDPDIIAARVVKYTYGVGTNTRFIKDKHPESKKKLINGIEYCTDKFDIHVNKGTLVHSNEETLESYSPLYEDQTSAKFGVFVSDTEYPQYTVDEGCREIGSLTVPMPNTAGGTRRKVKAKFKFGATKITVEGIDESSGKSVDVKFDFLED
uniref:Heat shock 70 kDa protein 12A n=1 Tax=Magallana gigas TaxID=29159 RepID=K1RWH3_MAGGI